jgi:hypothetical protein
MRMLRLAASLIICGLFIGQSSALAASNPDTKTSIVFVGTTPFGEPLKNLLQLPPKADALRWELTLETDPKGLTPSRYKLQCDVVLSPGVNEKKTFTATREGKCVIAKGAKSDPEAVVLELENAFSVLQVTKNLLHILNPDRSLMVGTAGFSYTLNQIDAAEKPGDLALALSRPSISYTNSPLAQGPSVFGVFEGRTPGIGIARELGFSEDPGCLKVKWRITLFQNPETKTPTTCRVENSLYRGRAREGRWTITKGTAENPNAVVYSLAATEAGPELCLLKGDENVLFLLNHRKEPMVGHADFSYSLNRRQSAPEQATRN